MLFQLFGTSQNSISTFLKNIQIFVFPCCSTREDLSIDVSITNVGLISTKPGWCLFSGNRQNSISSILNYFEKKINFLGFNAVVLMNTFPLIYQLLM